MNIEQIAKTFIYRMMPKPGIGGLDWESHGWHDLKEEIQDEYGLDDSEIVQVLDKAKELLEEIGHSGFGLFDGTDND